MRNNPVRLDINIPVMQFQVIQNASIERSLMQTVTEVIGQHWPNLIQNIAQISIHKITA